MKQLLVVFSLILISVSCNTKPKETAKTEVVEIMEDTAKIEKKAPINITKDFVLGKFDYKKDSTFLKVSLEHSAKELYLNKEVYKAFLDMHTAASKDGIKLEILSGTRNFDEQKVIWERKWRKYKNLEPLQRSKKILEYSSMPSTSRHHWGTDIDLNSLNNSYFNSGKGLEEYKWLTTHANRFGFYQVYTNKGNDRTGYNLEKWHWSYLPLASQYLEYYNATIDAKAISGFKGSELAETLNIIEDYVNGVSEKVKTYK